MRGKKFYIILAAVLLVGISSVYFFRKQREAQFLAFEAYEIANVEAQVNGLYNENKTDIHENLSEHELSEIDEQLEALKEREYSPKNTARLANVETDFADAIAMHELQTAIDELFVEPGVIDKNLSADEVTKLEAQIEAFQERTVFYERNQANLAEVKTQVQEIQLATAFIESLFEEGVVREDVTREEEAEALALIEKIKNPEAKEELLARAETLNIALTEAEEALALEEALAEEAALSELEEEEEEEEENPYSSSLEENGSSNTSGGTWTPPSNSDSGTGNWRPQNPAPSQSSPTTPPSSPPTEPESPNDQSPPLPSEDPEDEGAEENQAPPEEPIETPLEQETDEDDPEEDSE